MHVQSKQSVLDSAKKYFAEEFVVGNADSHPQEFSHWLAVQQSVKGAFWGAEQGEVK